MIDVDQHTKEMAEDYANTEADIRGFERGSSNWKKAYANYVEFAVSTMSVGRNPRAYRYKIFTSLYPDVFSEDGFAGRIAQNYIGQSGQKGVPLKDIQSRIMASVTNLVKLFENGVLGTKTTTKGREQGKIDNENMSDLQLPERKNLNSEDEYQAMQNDVIRNWLIRDLVTNAVIESLAPFFKLTKNDVDELINYFRIDDATLNDIQKGKREDFVKAIRAHVRNKFQNVDYKKLLLGK